MVGITLKKVVKSNSNFGKITNILGHSKIESVTLLMRQREYIECKKGKF